MNLPKSTPLALSCASAREKALEEALRQAIQVIEWCGLNDRTPNYEYGEARRNGDLPGKGRTFNTPREFASWWPSRLRETLEGVGARV